jgi:hypothetical protein
MKNRTRVVVSHVAIPSRCIYVQGYIVGSLLCCSSGRLGVCVPYPLVV